MATTLRENCVFGLGVMGFGFSHVAKNVFSKLISDNDEYSWFQFSKHSLKKTVKPPPVTSFYMGADSYPG